MSNMYIVENIKKLRVIRAVLPLGGDLPQKINLSAAKTCAMMDDFRDALRRRLFIRKLVQNLRQDDRRLDI